MKKSILFLLLCLNFHFASAFEVVKLSLPKSDKVVVKVMFRNGSASDPDTYRGITQLTASLVVEGGTSELTAAQVKEMLYPKAARMSVAVDKEVSVFTFEFHKDHTAEMLKLIAGLLMRPGMRESDFNRIKSNQLNYVNEVIRSSSDEDFSKMALEDLLFRGTNYQHMVMGTSLGIEKITLEQVKSHYKEMFRGAEVTVGVAASDVEGIVTNLKGAFGEYFAFSGQSAAIPMANQPEGIEVEIISKSQALGSAIFTGFPLNITRKDDDFAALMVANSWLGEHRKSYSRLYQKIREQRSMNYGDYSYIEWYDNGGSNMLPAPHVPRSANYFGIWIRPVQTGEGLKKQYSELENIKIGHALFAIRMAIREFDLLVKNGLAPDDFELTRDFLRSYMKLYVQTPSRQLGFLMDSKFYGRTDYLKDMDALLAKLKLEDVNAAVRKYWQSGRMFISVVTDDSEAEPLKQHLLENSSSPMVYSDALRATLPPSILEEDELVSNYPLKATKVRIVSADELFR